ncbi:hypothetical protein [Halostreptopolyspora alba]|uniref:DUF4878 domain-containing protein n=1 Tax=Halostreptopolyspora alba TaxID=2487137 RepID=A0A3N0E4C7_9ACTN|nr:hypothetical protein EFW17_18480 [Nocardiopsaceae bacterium YIM 96095]
MRRLPLTPYALALLLTLTACGGSDGTDEEPEQESAESSAEEDGQDQGAPPDGGSEGATQARAAAEDFLEALRDGDGETGCALIAEEAHASVALTATAPGTVAESCEPAFPTYAEGFNGADVAEIDEVEMGTDDSGETPIATVTLEYTAEVDGETADDLLFWLMDDGEWRIRTVPFGGLSG